MRIRKKGLCLLVVSVVTVFYLIDNSMFSSHKYQSHHSHDIGDNEGSSSRIMSINLLQKYKNFIGQESFREMKHQLETLNANHVDQEDSELIRIIKKFWLFKPSINNYTLVNSEKEDFSMGQSEIVDRLLNRKERGFFIECGALDGETRSNTLFLERNRYWEGLLIEASVPNFMELLKKHRKAYTVPACLGVNTHPKTMKFNEAVNRGRLIDTEEAYRWIEKGGLELNLSEVQCFPLYSLLLAVGKTHIDYLSLDVEGVELDVLRTIPWDKVDISVITVEFFHNKEGKETLLQYVLDKGYKLITEVKADKNWANDYVFIKKSLYL